MEESHFQSMMALIGNFFFLVYRRDGRVWMRSKNGLFPVASSLALKRVDMVAHSPLGCLWKIKAQPRVLAFGWLVLLGSLTMDNLCRRNRIIVNACLWQQRNQLTICSLIASDQVCSISVEINVNPNTLLQLYDAWKMGAEIQRERLITFCF